MFNSWVRLFGGRSNRRARVCWADVTLPPRRQYPNLPSDPAAFASEARATISRAALLHNARILRKAAGGAKLCAVVKADAYGHGAGIVAEALTALMVADGPAEPAAAMLAVASLDEAIALGGPPVPVLILRPVANAFAGRTRRLLAEAVRRDWVLSLIDAAGADDLARVAERVGKRANVCVAMDTGMNREGVPRQLFRALLDRVQGMPQLRLHSVSTHLVESERPGEPMTDIQLECFDDETSHLPSEVLRHAENSGGSLNQDRKFAGYDLIRPGIALYGIHPVGRPMSALPLRPALKLLAPIMAIREVAAGATVGYNRTWMAEKPTRIGLVPVGYADGFPRLAGVPDRRGKAAVVGVGGAGGSSRPTFCAIVGTVSMDYLTIDLTPAPNAAVGELVTVIDDEPGSPASIYNLARRAQTIPYEILCHVGGRVPRVPIEPTDAELMEADEVDEVDGSDESDDASDTV